MTRLAAFRSPASTVVYALATGVVVMTSMLLPATVRAQPPGTEPDKPRANHQDNDTSELVPRYSDGTPRAEAFADLVVEDYVTLLAAQLNCTFTLETFSAGAGPAPRRSYKVMDLPVSHLDELVPLLQERLPEFEVSRDRHDPTVVQLMDKRLRTWKDYPLDRKVKVNYHGRVRGFFEQLAKAKMPLSLGLEGSGGFDVYETDFHVALDVEGWTVREMLTQICGRKQYGRFLWEADTHKAGREESDELEACVFFERRWPAVTKEPEAAPAQPSADEKPPETPAKPAP